MQGSRGGSGSIPLELDQMASFRYWVGMTISGRFRVVHIARRSQPDAIYAYLKDVTTYNSPGLWLFLKRNQVEVSSISERPYHAGGRLKKKSAILSTTQKHAKTLSTPYVKIRVLLVTFHGHELVLGVFKIKATHRRSGYGVKAHKHKACQEGIPFGDAGFSVSTVSCCLSKRSGRYLWMLPRVQNSATEV
ncbi:hypothetical protein VNO77_41837 [Canavalia gladiata]|uniref:Uncharacterized protein n=1 Tax=Canavalia gladiata TaxID=3824 RepID=A0AAN9JZL4_CANGL